MRIRAQYSSELTTARLFMFFSVMAISIACLGLYGLSAFVVERRKNEIGLRKVMGAEVKDIVFLLILQFTSPVLLASLIAWPLASYFMLNWLESYSYRISGMWLIPICFFVGFITLAISWLTVGINANIIARKSPIESLRYE